MHNGLVHDFARVKRDLVLAIDEGLYPSVEGSTDSEVLVHLALTFGLEQDPPSAVARMVGFVEETGRRHGVEHPIQMTIATTDGENIWGFRFSNEGKFQEVSDESRIVVSEPLGDLEGAWNEVPESSYGVIKPGDDELHPFQPVAA